MLNGYDFNLIYLLSVSMRRILMPRIRRTNPSLWKLPEVKMQRNTKDQLRDVLEDQLKMSIGDQLKSGDQEKMKMDMKGQLSGRAVEDVLAIS